MKTFFLCSVLLALGASAIDPNTAGLREGVVDGNGVFSVSPFPVPASCTVTEIAKLQKMTYFRCMALRVNDVVQAAKAVTALADYLALAIPGAMGIKQPLYKEDVRKSK